MYSIGSEQGLSTIFCDTGDKHRPTDPIKTPNILLDIHVKLDNIWPTQERNQTTENLWGFNLFYDAGNIRTLPSVVV